MLLYACCFAVLPIFGIAAFFATRRSRATRALSIPILASGLATGVLVAIIALCYFGPDLISDLPGWETVAALLAFYALIFLYIGFGVGSVTVSLLSVPAALVIALMRSKRNCKASGPRDLN